MPQQPMKTGDAKFDQLMEKAVALLETVKEINQECKTLPGDGIEILMFKMRILEIIKNTAV